jgi:hypothetical protein
LQFLLAGGAGEAAHGAPIQTELAGDLRDRLSGRAQGSDRLVALAGPGHDPQLRPGSVNGGGRASAVGRRVECRAGGLGWW